jgi:HK97 family phage portal protein
MGLLDRISNAYNALTGRATYIAWTGQNEELLQGLLPRVSSSGIDVSPEVAYQISIVYACVNKIASTCAMLPIYLTDERDGKFRNVTNNPSTRLLNVSPDGEINAYYFRQSLYAMACLFGRGYARIERGYDGRPVRIVYHPTTDVLEKVVPSPDNSFTATMYRITIRNGTNTTMKWVPASDIIVLRSLFGQSASVVNRDAIGLLKAAQDYAAEFFRNGGVMSGLMTSEQPLKQDQITELLKSWEQQKGKQTRLMPWGLKYHRFGVEPDKAQNTESRKFNAQEVCRIFNVPPAMVGLDGGSGYKDYENQAKSFATMTIAPFCASIECELNLKLLFQSEQGAQYFRHDIDELMRGDMNARSNYYDKMLQNGVFSRDEVRQIERYNPIEGGTIHTVQVNQIALQYLEEYSAKVAAQAEVQQATTTADDNNNKPSGSESDDDDDDNDDDE